MLVVQFLSWTDKVYIKISIHLWGYLMCQHLSCGFKTFGDAVWSYKCRSWKQISIFNLNGKHCFWTNGHSSKIYNISYSFNISIVRFITTVNLRGQAQILSLLTYLHTHKHTCMQLLKTTSTGILVGLIKKLFQQI